MKTTAYYIDKNGDFHRITAWQVYIDNDTQANKWKGTDFYPQRAELYPMHASRRNDKRFFKFKSDRDRIEYENQGGGESKTHELVKLAICELECTTLYLRGLKKKGVHKEKIRFTSATDEYKHDIGDNTYFIDAFCRFESDGVLGEKWKNHIGIEVFHTHETPLNKIKALQSAKFPIIEFEIKGELKEYWGDEDDCDEEEEKRYISYVKRKLSNSMSAKVLSNPSSNAYLGKLCEELINTNDRLKHKLSSTQSNYEELESDYQDLKKDLLHKKSTIDSLNERVEEESCSNKNLRAKLQKVESMGVLAFCLFKVKKKIRGLFSFLK